MIVAIVRNQSCWIRLRGSEIELKKSRTKSSGNIPCTASPEPVRIAIHMPMPPNPIEIMIESRKQDRDAGDAGLEVGAGGEPDREVDGRLDQADHDQPAELAGDQRGAAHRGQREPVEEAVLDVLGERLARVHRREEGRPG